MTMHQGTDVARELLYLERKLTDSD